MRKGIEIARANGRKVAFTLSDSFCISRHRADFRALIDGGVLDILFANEGETRIADGDRRFRRGGRRGRLKVPLLVVTRGADGAIAVANGERFTVPAEPIERIVDTTGAGDLFAAGFLAGHVRGKAVPDCLTMGAVAAAEVISHYGARPEAGLAALIESRLGR